MKMAPRPSSPSSLLWAHQLKREHGFLLGRMQQLESSNERQEDRLKKTETIAKTTANNDIAALTEKVNALDGDAIVKRLVRVEKEVMCKLEDVQADSEAMIMKVASLEKAETSTEEERRKTFNKEKALLKRVGEVEGGLVEYQQSLLRVGRRVDEASIGTIKAQLEGLAKQVGREGAGMKRLEESIEVLEAANTELKKSNERLAAEIARLAERPQIAPAAKKASKDLTTEVLARRDSQVSSEDNTPRPPVKKSHKWAGGGADRDIIQQNSNSAKKKPTTPLYKSLNSKALPQAKQVTKLKPAAKIKETAKPKEVRKSIDLTRAKGVAKPKHVATSVATTKQQRTPLVYLDGEAEKPIVRAGKGWIEVAASEDESQEIRRSVGRPRKHPRLDTLEKLGQDTQRLTRGARQQLTQNKTVPQKRKAESEATGATQKYRPSNAMKQSKGRQFDFKRFGAKVEESEVYRSPASSPEPALTATPQSASGGARAGALLEALKSQPSQPAQPPVKRRRVIEQMDDGALLQQYV